MALWRPGMRITAALLNSNVSTSQSYGFTAADPDWTLSGIDIRITGKVVTLTMDIDFNGIGGDGVTPIDAGTDGNIGDTSMGVLTDEKLLPASDFGFQATNGYGDGGGTVYANGNVNIRTWNSNATIDPGTHMLVSATYVTA